MTTSKHPWGQGIEPGVTVTSEGRHGAGQPVVFGRVVAVEGQTVVIQAARGQRRRTISNVRRVSGV